MTWKRYWLNLWNLPSSVKHSGEMDFRKVGYDKAGYTVEQIAPLFSEARTVRNILLPKAIVSILN